MSLTALLIKDCKNLPKAFLSALTNRPATKLPKDMRACPAWPAGGGSARHAALAMFKAACAFSASVLPCRNAWGAVSRQAVKPWRAFAQPSICSRLSFGAGVSMELHQSGNSLSVVLGAVLKAFLKSPNLTIQLHKRELSPHGNRAVDDPEPESSSQNQKCPRAKNTNGIKWMQWGVYITHKIYSIHDYTHRSCKGISHRSWKKIEDLRQRQIRNALHTYQTNPNKHPLFLSRIAAGCKKSRWNCLTALDPSSCLNLHSIKPKVLTTLHPKNSRWFLFHVENCQSLKSIEK